MRWFVGAALCLLGCGRLDFAELAPGADASAPVPFGPASSGCLAAGSGPFTELALFPTAGGGYGLWSAPPYVLAADTTGGLHSLRFTGASFAEVGRLANLGWVEAVVGDGTYFYVGAPGTAFYVVTLASDGSLAVRATDTTIPEARHAWFANGLVYVPAGGNGLYAVRYDGTNLSHVGTPAGSLEWAQGVWADPGHVYFADAGRFRVLAFDGNQFTDTIAPQTTHPGTSRVWGTGDVVFVAGSDGVTARRLVGGDLVELALFPTAAAARDVWSDGQHVFVAAEEDGLYALAFDTDHFTELAHVPTTSQMLGVFGDGTYIYANDQGQGVHAYAGFACTAW